MAFARRWDQAGFDLISDYPTSPIPVNSDDLVSDIRSACAPGHLSVPAANPTKSDPPLEKKREMEGEMRAEGMRKQKKESEMSEIYFFFLLLPLCWNASQFRHGAVGIAVQSEMSMFGRILAGALLWLVMAARRFRGVYGSSSVTARRRAFCWSVD